MKQFIKNYLAKRKQRKEQRIIEKYQKLVKEQTVADIMKMLLDCQYPKFCFWYFLETPIQVTGFAYPTLRSISYEKNATFNPDFEINRFVDRKGIYVNKFQFFELLLTASQDNLTNLKEEISKADLNKRNLNFGGFIE